MSIQSTESPESSVQFVGWQSSPDERGSIDIIYSCLAVIVTGVWTVLHLNVPARGDSLLRIVVRRLRWSAVSVMAPDMLTMFAASQWLRARQSVEQMRELAGAEPWSLEHAFFANSGGG